MCVDVCGVQSFREAEGRACFSICKRRLIPRLPHDGKCPKQKRRSKAAFLRVIEAGPNGFGCTLPQAQMNRYGLILRHGARLSAAPTPARSAYRGLFSATLKPRKILY